MPAPEIIAPTCMLPDEMEVTSRRAPLSIPVKDTETGAIELPVVVATTGILAFSAFCISVAAAAKLATPERLTEPVKRYPWEVIDREPLTACNCASVIL